jgi:hypothetical protein
MPLPIRRSTALQSSERRLIVDENCMYKVAVLLRAGIL